MELLLWRWSTAVQATSLVLLALFFTVLARSIRLVEVTWWARAWACNLAALIVTLFYWYVEPPRVLFPLVCAAYMLAKTAFVVLLIRGAWTLKRPGDRVRSVRQRSMTLLLYAGAATLFTTTIDRLGLAQHFVVGGLLAAGAVPLLTRPRERGTGWLAAGMLLRSLLAFGESAAYALQILPSASFGLLRADRAGAFLAASSSFDSGVEWFLALGSVLALSERVQRELRHSNAGLLAAQEGLRRLADRDPLTALSNRRLLPDAFRSFQPQGALLLFFDLDDFKGINDRHGHDVGDECLRRFAGALRDCFRPRDALVRWAGDEFLVVAAGLDESSARERIRHLRERLDAGAGFPPIRFSVGISRLAPDGHPDEALRAADRSMYAAKAARDPRPVAS
jgi:diguanylate cyclase (GGDEF)-like protein